MTNKANILIGLTFILSLAIQPNDAGAQGEASAAEPFLNEKSIRAEIVEVVADAIPQWRAFREQKPALLLLSQNPFLFAAPGDLQEKVNQLALKGETEDFQHSARLSHSNPLLPLQQTLRVCLQNDFFSEVTWILHPALGNEAKVDSEKIMEELLASGAITPDEEKSFKKEAGQLTGVVEGTPFTISSLDQLKQTENTTIIHFDLSFFLNAYSSAVKTPIHKIIQNSLKSLKSRNIPVYTSTISLTTGPGLTPIEFRFLGDDLKTLISEPEALTKPLSSAWENRQKILYLEYFFQPEETKRLVELLLEETPDDPWVHFWNYKITAKRKEIIVALGMLDRAISLDPGYADEYLILAEKAAQRGLFRQAANFVAKALEVFPDNALAELKLVEFELNSGKTERALERIRSLQKKTWSNTYHPTVPTILKDMESFALTRTEELKAKE